MPLLNYNSNSTEQTLYHAQKIIDYFSGNLKTSGCLSSIPITLVAEADHIIDKINGIKDAVDNNTAGLNNNITKYQNDPIAAAIRRASGNNCLDCRPTLPKIRFEGMKGQAYFEAVDFLNKIKSIGAASFSASLPSLAFILSSFCIPDLIKLLSLLLASVIRLGFSLDVSKFSFMKLLTAILSKLLSHLLSFAHTSVQFSLSPIMCVLDALSQLNSSLTPVKESNFNLSINQAGININDKDALSKAKAIEERDNEFKKIDERSNTNIFLGTSIRSKSLDFENFRIVSAARDTIKAITPNEREVEQLKDYIDGIVESINLSLIDMESTILEIFNIGQAIQCESERSTRKASDSIESIVQWVQLINLIRSVIKKKTRTIAVGVVSNTDYQNNILTNQDIADILADTLDKTTILVDTDPDNIGVLIIDNKNNITSSSPLSIYSCNINDFIESTHMDKIIEDAKTFAENNTVGKGNDPKYVASEYIKVGNDNFLPFNLQNKDILLQLKGIFNFLNIKNPYDNIKNPYDNELPTTNTPPGDVNSILSITDKINSTFGNIGQIRI